VNDEKMARSKLRSNCQKYMDKDTIVILDSMNYIKGFRYELFCLMRSFKTTYCVIYCNTKVEKAREFHKNNPNGMSEELFEDYCKRMEEPHRKSSILFVEFI